MYCHYFVYTQRPEDRILQVLVRKTDTIKRELGSLSQVIDAQLTKTLSQGIRRTQIDRLVGEIAAADLDAASRRTSTMSWKQPRAANALREQIERPHHFLMPRRRVSAWTRPISGRRFPVP